MFVAALPTNHYLNVRHLKVSQRQRCFELFLVYFKMCHCITISTDCVVVGVVLKFIQCFSAVEMQFLDHARFSKRIKVAVDRDQIDVGQSGMYFARRKRTMVMGEGVENFLTMFGKTHSR